MVEFNSSDKKVVQELVLPFIIRKAPKQAKACLQNLTQGNSTLHTATRKLKNATSLHGKGAQLLSLVSTPRRPSCVFEEHEANSSTKRACSEALHDESVKENYVYMYKDMYIHRRKICEGIKSKYAGVCMIFCHMRGKKDTNTKKERNDQCHSHVVSTKESIRAVSSTAKCIKPAMHSKPQNMIEIHVIKAILFLQIMCNF
jgi:hypothetical protein